MMTTVCANGSTFSSLFVIKENDIAYRMIDREITWDQEIVFNCLPKGSLYEVRDYHALWIAFTFRIGQLVCKVYSTKNCSGLKGHAYV